MLIKKGQAIKWVEKHFKKFIRKLFIIVFGKPKKVVIQDLDAQKRVGAKKFGINLDFSEVKEQNSSFLEDIKMYLNPNEIKNSPKKKIFENQSKLSNYFYTID